MSSPPNTAAALANLDTSPNIRNRISETGSALKAPAQWHEPAAVRQALDFIARLYQLEEEARHQTVEDKRQHRLAHSKPVVDAFFAWSGDTRNWKPSGLVKLNPERDEMPEKLAA